jgi:hypothetical protein
MGKVALDYDDDCWGTDGIFWLQEDFIRFQCIKRETDMEDLGSSDLPFNLNRETPLQDRGSTLNEVVVQTLKPIISVVENINENKEKGRASLVSEKSREDACKESDKEGGI